MALPGEEDATQQAHLQNLFTRMQGSKGGKFDSQMQPQSVHVSVFLSDCFGIHIWIAWGVWGKKKKKWRRQAADGAPVRKWAGKKRCPPDSFFFFFFLSLANQHETAAEPSRADACVPAGHGVDSDKTMCWTHLHNFLDCCCLQSSGCKTVWERGKFSFRLYFSWKTLFCPAPQPKTSDQN